jgi:hypothetical protein
VIFDASVLLAVAPDEADSRRFAEIIAGSLHARMPVAAADDAFTDRPRGKDPSGGWRRHLASMAA